MSHPAALKETFSCFKHESKCSSPQHDGSVHQRSAAGVGGRRTGAIPARGWAPSAAMSAGGRSRAKNLDAGEGGRDAMQARPQTRVLVLG